MRRDSNSSCECPRLGKRGKMLTKRVAQKRPPEQVSRAYQGYINDFIITYVAIYTGSNSQYGFW